MNPDTNKFEMLNHGLIGADDVLKLFRPNGSPVPKHWTILTVDELVEIKGYTFKVVYINESTLILEPVKLELTDNIKQEGTADDKKYS